MTPMIDVVFLLIIFFLVSSHLAKQENSVKLDLPKAISGLPEEVNSAATLTLNVLPNGTWQLGGATVNRAQLGAAIVERARSLTEPLRLKIRSDQSVPYQQVEPVLEVANQQGVGDIVFSVYEDSSQRGSD